MRYVSIALLCAATIALVAPTASAQFYPRYHPVYVSPDYAGPAYYSARGPAFYCPKDCAQDTSPCDPPEYKRTDARCSSPTAGVR